MRKVVFAINMSIDGCISHMNLIPDEEVFQYFHNFVLKDVDLIAYGRKTYEIMFPYWAEEENRNDKLEQDFGQWLTDMDKITFSRTLKNADYNTKVINADPATELFKLKQMQGGT